MEVEVRRAERHDLDVLVELVGEYCAADRHTFDPASVRAGAEPMLCGDRVGVIWLAVVDGDVDAYAAVTWGWSIEIGGFEVVLDELYVRTRGRGVGSLLLESVEADCRERGAGRIVLETELSNESARRLYRRHGYVADSSIWMAKELP